MESRYTLNVTSTPRSHLNWFAQCIDARIEDAWKDVHDMIRTEALPKTLVQDYATWYDENGMQHNDPIGKMYEI